MAQRKIVIHNHLPVRKTRDATFTKGNLGNRSPEALREINRLRKELSDVDMNKPGALKKYDDILAKLKIAESKDAKDAELNYSTVMKGWMFRVGGKNYGPYPDEAKAQAEMSKAKGGATDEAPDPEKIRKLYKSWVAGGQKPIEAIGELADNFGISEQQVKKIVGR